MMKFPSKNTKTGSGGYSLISMSLMIVVLGILAVVGVGLSKQYGWTKKQDTSQEMIARVEDALRNYRALHGRLPCPAPMNVGPGGTGFGVSECSVVSTAAPHSVVEVPGSRTAAASVKIGSVPVRSLNLPDDAMLDGWGRRLVYAVTSSYAPEEGNVNFDNDSGQISIVDAEGHDMTPTAVGSVIYAVITPGADGRGAVNLAGNLISACTAGPAFENCDMANAKFTSLVMKQYDTGTQAYTASMKYATGDKGYRWTVGGWSDCDCGATPGTNPLQNRAPPVCRDMAGTAVDSSLCAGLEQPESGSRSCLTYCWNVVAPPACTAATCEQTLTGSVTCERNFSGSFDIVGGDNCKEFKKQGVRTAASTTCPSCPPPPPPPYSGSSSSGSDGGVTYYSYHGYDFTVDHNGNSWAGNTPYNSGVSNNYGNMPSSSGSSSSSSSSSGSSSGSSRVICTHFYRRKKLAEDLWRADLEFTASHLSWTTVRGYQLWGIRSVYLMRAQPWTEPFFFFLAINRAEEIGYQLGIRSKPNYIGKAIRYIMEPICFLIGIFTPEQDWKKVHGDMAQA